MFLFLLVYCQLIAFLLNLFLYQGNIEISRQVFGIKDAIPEINFSSQLSKIKKKKKIHEWLTWLGYSINHLPNSPDYYTFRFALLLCPNTVSAYFLVIKITNIRTAVTEFTEGLYSNNKIASPLLLQYTNYVGEGIKDRKKNSITLLVFAGLEV